MIAVQAELTQTPFDMPIAESELVSGYMTEYSGFRFLIFFIAEFATAGVFALIAAVLFLGGWGVPFSWFGWDTLDDVDNWMNVAGPLIMFTKMMVLTFIIMWVRFSYPRFREDQLQRFAWKVLIPLSLLNIVVTAVLKVRSDVECRRFPGSSRVSASRWARCSARVKNGAEHGAVPAREGVAADPSRVVSSRCARTTAPSCMLCARVVPRLVHLHRGPQDARPAAPRRRQAAQGQQPRPLRHRLRAVHVLRHLRRGVPVRRACSGAPSTSTPSRASPTCCTTRPSSASGWRPCPRRPSSKSGAAKK